MDRAAGARRSRLITATALPPLSLGLLGGVGRRPIVAAALRRRVRGDAARRRRVPVDPPPPTVAIVSVALLASPTRPEVFPAAPVVVAADAAAAPTARLQEAAVGVPAAVDGEAGSPWGLLPVTAVLRNVARLRGNARAVRVVVPGAAVTVRRVPISQEVPATNWPTIDRLSRSPGSPSRPSRACRASRGGHLGQEVVPRHGLERHRTP